MDATPSYTGPERRLDPTRLIDRDHAVRAISVPDAKGKIRFGTNGREDINTVDGAQLQGGEQFRGEVLAVLSCLHTESTPEEFDVLPTHKTSDDEAIILLLNEKHPNVWIAKIEALGWKFLNDSRLYEDALKEHFSEGRLRLDSNTFTVLNVKTRIKAILIVFYYLIPIMCCNLAAVILLLPTMHLPLERLRVLTKMKKI